MAGLLRSVVESEAFGFTVLIFAFLCGASLFYLSYSFLVPSLDIRRRLGSADPIGREALRLVGTSGDVAQRRVREAIETYYRSIEDDKETSLRRRMVRAGFFAQGAPRVYNLIRAVIAVGLFAVIMLFVPMFMPSLRYSQVVFLAFGIAGLMLI